MKLPLDGRLILIVEDEPIIAMDLQSILGDQGAQTLTAHSIAEALVAVETPSVSAAVLDHALGDGDSSALCRLLAERNIPFITCSGNPHITGACSGVKNVDKPILEDVFVAAVVELFD